METVPAACEEGWPVHTNDSQRLKSEYASANAAKSTKERITKFGYQVPRNLQDAYKLDKENGNSKWAEAIRVEVNKLKEYDDFEAMAEGARAQEGYSRIPLHWVFDEKHDFRHQARIVAGGHVAPIPDESPSSSVVWLKGMRILLFLSQLFKLNLTRRANEKARPATRGAI